MSEMDNKEAETVEIATHETNSPAWGGEQLQLSDELAQAITRGVGPVAIGCGGHVA